MCIFIFESHQPSGHQVVSGLRASIHPPTLSGLVGTYIRFFRHPRHHHFFIILPTPFYIDFGSILDSNLEPKSYQNLSKIHPKSDLGHYQHFSLVFHRILKDLAPLRTLQVVLPSRREANFQDFALLLLH